MDRLKTIALALAMALVFAGSALAGGLQPAIEGLLAQNRGDYHKAIELYSEAIKAGDLAADTVADLYTNRGTLWCRLGDNQRALQDYGEAIKKDPKCAMAHTNRGALYRRLGQAQNALADYAKAIELAATATGAATYTKPGQTKQGAALVLAREALQEQWLTRRRAAALAYFNRGNLLMDQGQFQKALADYDQAVGLDPRMAKAYFNRALAREGVGQLDKAMRDMKMAASLEPGRNNYQKAYKRLAGMADGSKPRLASQ